MPFRPSVACVTVMPCSSSVLVIANTLRGSSSITRILRPRSASCSPACDGERAWVSVADSLISAGT